MIEQSKFLEMIKEITEIARVQENRITKEEVKAFFGDTDVSEEQFSFVYQYLAENGITVPGYLMKQLQTIEENETADEEEQEKKPEESSVSYRLYMEELGDMEALTTEEKTRLFLEVREGSAEAKEQLLQGYLPMVVQMAEKYQNKGMLLDDLIQEGNIGLLMALEQISEVAKLEDTETFLVETIRQTMVEAVDLEIGEHDRESTLLAKTGLISEAAKYLAEDLGRVATAKELADFTKLSENEVTDILKLSLDAVELGKGDL